jgi:dTDP-4-amino-4,6-dideoxygalactose transaminase
VHYPRLIPDQPPLRALGHSPDSLSAAARLCREVVSLPCYPELEDADVQRVAVAVSTFVSPDRDAPLAEG